jgi:hypothetical protein
MMVNYRYQAVEHRFFTLHKFDPRMKAPTTKYQKASLIGITIICLMNLAITLPNLGRIANGNDDIPRFSIPRGFPSRIYYSWLDVLYVVVAVLPIVLVYVGVRYHPFISALGWVIGIFLLLALIMR